MPEKQYGWYKGYMQLKTKAEWDIDKTGKEPMWKNAGKTEGLQVWRIQNMRVTSWPKEDYGRFYDGDSYIILKTVLPQKQYDVHTWIGKYSTEDEFTTATSKMLQLCTYLDDKPVQHREAQEKESKQFKSYFNEFTYLHGGAQSSLSDTDAPVSRLFHFHGRNMKATVKQIPMDPEKIDDSDVYILDRYTDIIQWNGKGCNNGEKAAASRYIQKLKSERCGKSVKVDIIDQCISGGRTDEFFQAVKICSEQEQKNKEGSELCEEGQSKNNGEEENFDFSTDYEDLDPKDPTPELYRKRPVQNESRYIDDVLSINKPKFADYLCSIYPLELEVKENTETNISASYLDITLSYDNDGHMNTSLYDKRDDLNFSIANFPFLAVTTGFAYRQELLTIPGHPVSLQNVVHSEDRNCSSGNSNDFALPSRLGDRIAERYFFEVYMDVMIYDTKNILFVWIGKNANQKDKKNAMHFAHAYLFNTDHPVITVTCMKEGEETAEFLSSLEKR